MIILKVNKDIEKSLKKYKHKFNDLKIMNELKDRKTYSKPSDKKRKNIEKAKYIQKKYRDE